MNLDILGTVAGRFCSYLKFQLKLLPYKYLLLQPRYRMKVLMLNGQKFTIPDSISFYFSYKEVFVENIYQFDSDVDDPYVVDCGSNCGTSIVYFKKLYPKSRVIGVEADPQIYEILKSNIELRGYSDVALLNRAVSTSSYPVEFWSEGADGGRIVDGGGGGASRLIRLILFNLMN